MKQLKITAFFICLLLMGLVINANSQTVKKDANGNLYAVKAPKDSTGGKKTSILFTDTDGTVYPVYEGSRGGIYIIRINKKTGKETKRYLKLEN